MKRHTALNLMAVGIILANFISCSPLYYVPNVQQVPLFTDKNQGTINTGMLFMDPGGLALSGAYSITNHFGLVGNFIAVGSKTETSIEKGVSTGLGVIYYLPIKENLVFETTVGTAFGNAINGNFDGLDIQNKVNFNSFYVQPSLGMVYKNFEMALSVKYNIHSFSNLSADFLSYYEQGLVTYSSFYGGSGTTYTNPLDNPYHFIEPALTVRIGWQSVKFSMQYVYSMRVSSTELARQQYNINLGLHFRFGKKRFDSI